MVLWFRRDLRLDDLPALHAAVKADSDGVVPLFVADPSVLDPAGPNRRRFLAEALRALDQEVGGALVLREGDLRLVVPALAAEVGAGTVGVTADFGPYGSARDRAVGEALSTAGRSLVAGDSPYAVAPGTVRSSSGSPLQMFTPFRRAWESVDWERPLPVPEVRFVGVPSDITIDEIEAGVSEPGHSGLPAWWEGLPLGVAEHLPRAGSSAAKDQLERFVMGPLSDYAEDRDRPRVAGTSGLSPYLRFGCIHPRTVLMQPGTRAGADRMRAELVWREFYADVLWHRPKPAYRPLQAFGAHLRWDDDAQARSRFQAWATGRTGYSLVDAGMRQLLIEGWMHNRVRMITASFLVKTSTSIGDSGHVGSCGTWSTGTWPPTSTGGNGSPARVPTLHRFIGSSIQSSNSSASTPMASTSVSTSVSLRPRGIATRIRGRSAVATRIRSSITSSNGAKRWHDSMSREEVTAEKITRN